MVNVNYPHYQRDFFLAKTDPEEYPRWMWQMKDRKFVEAREGALNDEVLRRSRLAVKKINVIRRMLTSLNTARYELHSGLAFQETVYLTKKLEANAFRDIGYDEDRLLEFPYVLQYADFAGLSPRAAADAIILKAKMYDQHLLKTEALRLKHFNKLKDAASPEDAEGVYREFLQDFHLNARP
jgi:hypothetical protein